MVRVVRSRSRRARSEDWASREQLARYKLPRAWIVATSRTLVRFNTSSVPP